MTVATAIESSLGGSAAIGANSTATRAASTGKFSANAASQLATSASGPMSFSASWQSLLASLSTGATESEEAANALPAASTTLAATSVGETTTSASTLARSQTSSLTAEPAKSLEKSVASSVRAQASASQSASAETQPTDATKAATKMGSTGVAADASGTPRTTHSSKKTQPDAGKAGVISDAALNTLGPAVLVAPVPVTTNPLSSAAAAQTASSATNLSSGLPTGASQSFSLTGISGDVPEGKAAPTTVDQRLETGEAISSTVTNQAAATSASSESGDSAPVHPVSTNSDHSQNVWSTATSSLGGNTGTSRGQALSVPGSAGAPISNGSSGATGEEQTISTDSGSVLSLDGTTLQLPSSPGRFGGKSTAGQDQSQVPDGIQSQSAIASATSIGNGNINSLQVQAGNDTSQTISYTATASLTGTTAVAGKNRTSETGTKPTARAAGKSGLAPQGMQVHGQQVSTSSADAATILREPAAQGAANTTENAAKDNSGTASGLKETFAALDAEGATGKSTWIHAGAQHAEAGIQDPELGWVGVRADMSGGVVHASLVPGSADAAQALGGHLAGLNSYLSDHHTPVETLTLAAPETGWSGTGAGAGQSMGQGQADQQGQNPGGSPEAGATSNFSSSSASLTAAESQTSFQGFEEMKVNTSTVQVEGTHISVLA